MLLGLTIIQIEARILIFPGTDFHFPSTSVPSGTFLGSAYLRETKTYDSPPVESIRHAGNFLYPAINTAHFYFFVAEAMSNYLTTDGLKTFSLLPEPPPRGLRPVAFATSATWLIRRRVGSRHGLAPAVSRTTPGPQCTTLSLDQQSSIFHSLR